MTYCNQKTFKFQGLGKRKVTADFSGGYLSNDGGGLILREVELRTGEALSKIVPIIHRRFGRKVRIIVRGDQPAKKRLHRK